MDIHKPGSIVYIKLGSCDPVQGVILQACISGRSLRLTYEICWWDGRTYCEQWFDSGLISHSKGSTEPIGFKDVG